MEQLKKRLNQLLNEAIELDKKLLTALPKSILQEAIQGKLVPQDPNDEPASVLLERIREEKLRLVKEGKLKKKDVTDSIIFKGEDNKYYEQVGSECIDITEDIPFEIPANWSWCRLKDLCKIQSGATFKKEEVSLQQIGIRILRGGNILPFSLLLKNDDIFIPAGKIKDDILLQKDDIVTPAVTSLENIGKMARVECDLTNVTVGGFVFIIRNIIKGLPISRYLLISMTAPAMVDYMKSITNKSGQAFYNIGKERLSMMLLPIPPIPEQNRIIEKVDEIFPKL